MGKYGQGLEPLEELGYGIYFVMEYGLLYDQGTISDCSGRLEQRNFLASNLTTFCIEYSYMLFFHTLNS